MRRLLSFFIFVGQTTYRDTEGKLFTPEQVTGPMSTRRTDPPKYQTFGQWKKGYRVSRQYSRFTEPEHVGINIFN